MTDVGLVPAARYLRMSTERQQYSMANQSEVIEKYAIRHGFSVVQTYSDAARTGVSFRKRKGLQRLIQDVVQAAAPYKAILVYDVSRWGRFQDTDESAHYEYLCKAAGIPVHYCAELFSNDNGLSSLIMKSLKRVMAGEYSRELGVKIFAAQKRLAGLGFRSGGQPGYGLRRLLVSADGKTKLPLSHGQRKSLATDHVIQVLGPPDEVACVRDIYRLFLEEKLNFTEIMERLNERKTTYLAGKPWESRAVRKILTHPKYAGFNVYGRTSMRLYTPVTDVPIEEWTVLPNAFEALVDQGTFSRVQEVLAIYPRNRSDNNLLDNLRDTLTKQGKLSRRLIDTTHDIPSATTYRTRFGSLIHAYELIGYKRGAGRNWIDKFRKAREMREQLMEEIASLFIEDVSVEYRGRRFRTMLRLRNRRLISVVTPRSRNGYKGAKRWTLRRFPSERRHFFLVAPLNEKLNGFEDFLIVPPSIGCRNLCISNETANLPGVVRLSGPREFLSAVERAVAQANGSRPTTKPLDEAFALTHDHLSSKRPVQVTQEAKTSTVEKREVLKRVHKSVNNSRHHICLDPTPVRKRSKQARMNDVVRRFASIAPSEHS